jgi:exopolyphosphatase
MPLPRASLRSFLLSAKITLSNAAKQTSPVTFVVGNESAGTANTRIIDIAISNSSLDLDSLCSAVVLAYLRTYAPTAKSNILYIPLSNLPRADLSLRPELLPVLSHANLKPNDLITLSDLPTASSQIPPERTRWILVDHNALQGELGKIYGARVVGCIDHHDEENKVPKDTPDEPRIVRKSGSCSSLVVEYTRDTWDALAAKPSGEKDALWNAQLARLALAPVLIDTTNLTIESKTTPADVEAVKYLKHWIAAEEASKFTTTEYFKQISGAKEDIGGLSLRDILRKDYKEWTEAGSMNLGVSSVVKDISFLIEKAGSKEKFFEAVKEFAVERGLSICSIMTTSHPDGVFKRELFVWGLDEKGTAAAEKFAEDAEERLGLVQWKDGSLDLEAESGWRRGWWQQKVEHSRKQVAPLLRTSLAS